MTARKQDAPRWCIRANNEELTKAERELKKALKMIREARTMQRKPKQMDVGEWDVLRVCIRRSLRWAEEYLDMSYFVVREDA